MYNNNNGANHLHYNFHGKSQNLMFNQGNLEGTNLRAEVPPFIPRRGDDGIPFPHAQQHPALLPRYVTTCYPFVQEQGNNRRMLMQQQQQLPPPPHHHQQSSSATAVQFPSRWGPTSPSSATARWPPSPAELQQFLAFANMQQQQRGRFPAPHPSAAAPAGQMHSSSVVGSHLHSQPAMPIGNLADSYQAIAVYGDSSQHHSYQQNNSANAYTHHSKNKKKRPPHRNVGVQNVVTASSHRSSSSSSTPRSRDESVETEDKIIQTGNEYCLLITFLL